MVNPVYLQHCQREREREWAYIKNVGIIFSYLGNPDAHDPLVESCPVLGTQVADELGRLLLDLGVLQGNKHFTVNDFQLRINKIEIIQHGVLFVRQLNNKILCFLTIKYEHYVSDNK